MLAIRRGIAAVLAIWIVLLGLIPLLFATAGAQRSGGETIRVAFIDQNGLSRLTEDGGREGYDYEYLQEIAQYTGWNYEFVDFGSSNDELLKAMEMVKTGEIDLLTSIVYSDSLTEDYNFAAYSHGSVNTVLGVFDDNTTISETNLFKNNTLRVAVPEKALTRIQELEQFCVMSKMDVELVLCSNRVEQREAMRDGKADVMLEIDLDLPEDMRSVAHFAPRPFYFVSGKGNDGMMNRLNAALLNINQIDPYFSVGLYEKYFGNVDYSLHLAEEEQAYIRGVGAVRVAVLPDRMPVQGMDDETGAYTGLTRDVFDYITAATGLQFQFVPLNSGEEMVEMLATGTVELVAGVPYSYDTANRYGMVMSRPYFTAQTTYVLSRHVDPSALSGKTMAVAEGSGYEGGLTDQVREYPNVRACLDALERGEADFTIDNSYTVRYYANQSRHSNLVLTPRDGAEQKLCIGLGKPANTTLLTIINKTIRSIPESDMQAMLYRNANPQVKVTFASFVLDNPWLALGGVLVMAVVVVVLMLIYFRAHIRLSRREALENERYKQISELTNEHIFEYDFRTDTLILSERSAKAMGVDRVREHYRFRLEQDRSLTAEQEREFFKRIVRERAGSMDLRVTFPNGTQRWMRVTGKVVVDPNGKPVLMVGRLTDIHNEREELERLEEKAQRDSLTGVYNAETTRQLITRRLEESDGGGAFLIMDLDEFKSINDQNGHLTGDQALVAVSEILEETFRKNDIVGRLGGDEFIVFVSNVNERTVIDYKCRQILQAMAKLPSPLQELHLTVSIGAVMVDGKKDYNELYQLADKALYYVKENSRNGYRLS